MPPPSFQQHGDDTNIRQAIYGVQIAKNNSSITKKLEDSRIFWEAGTNSFQILVGCPPQHGVLPIIGNLPFLDHDLHAYFACLANTYGPIFKLCLGKKLVVVITSPSLAKQVLKDHNKTFANCGIPAVAKTITYGGWTSPLRLMGLSGA
ncbi:hypothetical protein Scep_006702 [Stephania cephalantha]|uniref:Uncharacterized protein n=1 Tax=Stephania cephalantha TaxID=152367 RepID=A0AAP0KB71_9MAGN